jgi:hypothetical protein
VTGRTNRPSERRGSSVDGAVHVRTAELRAAADAVQAIAAGSPVSPVPPTRSLPGPDAGLADAVHDLVRLDGELDAATRDAARRMGHTLATVVDEVEAADRFEGVR